MSILHRGFVKRYLARRGMSLVQEPGLSDFLDTRRVDLVIDVGANAGQFARDLRSLGYRGRIHSFEPLPTAFAELQSVAASDPLWEMSNVGVGRKAGKLEINIAKNSVFSSFRPLSELAGRFDPNSRTVETLRVPVVTLDNALGSDKAAIERAILQLREQSSPLSLPVKLEQVGDKLTVTVPASKDEKGQAEVWLCPITKSVPVTIGRGENSGHTITYTNVVRRWIKLGDWTGKAETFDVPVKTVKTGDIDAAAVVVQSGVSSAPKLMLGAAQMGLP